MFLASKSPKMKYKFFEKAMTWIETPLDKKKGWVLRLTRKRMELGFFLKKANGTCSSKE